MNADFARAIAELDARARPAFEERHRRMLAAKPVPDDVLIEFATRLELTGFLPLGCVSRVVQLVALAGVKP